MTGIVTANIRPRLFWKKTYRRYKKANRKIGDPENTPKVKVNLHKAYIRSAVIYATAWFGTVKKANPRTSK